ncbi:MAG: thiamine pyrophosphate-binding protein [Proteobacteria bacterium]|nr:thiamine pyrophosphate-binding protein [Pseudomonadota bacterium]
MKRTAAWLTVRALEELGVRYTFGIPGVHTTELYDELNASESVRPVLVTHELSGAYMADAVSRLSTSVGTLAVVPAAGLTHAASGIAEALLDGIPMLVLSGGIRTDLPYGYQLHELDLHAFMRGITKASFHPKTHADVQPMIYEAYCVATSGEPGPVFVELPANLLMMTGEAGETARYTPPEAPRIQDENAIVEAAKLLLAAKRPGLFVGWGALAELTAIAEFLQAPVATTLQGLSTFPGTHPLHTGYSFGAAAVPAARNAFKDCDALLAVGTRFAEIATGSFGVTVPEALVHVDINPKVFSRNYPAKIALEGDAETVLAALLMALRNGGIGRSDDAGLTAAIARDKAAYRNTWLAHDSKGRVNPQRFFDALAAGTPAEAITVIDDGNHTYLTAELYPVRTAGSVILPTDFNSMGYAVPAALGAALAHPGRHVNAIVGDGAFAMTCMEIATGVAQGLGVCYWVFHDGELSQIAQAQEIPYNRKPCAALPPLKLEGIAMATGAAYIRIDNDTALDAAIVEAHRVAAAGQPVIVDVMIDYSKRTAFTQGAVQTNLKRLPLRQKLRMMARALIRRFTG